MRVLAQMGVQTELPRHHNTTALKAALTGKVRANKPALAFLEWEGEASVVGHFVVIGSAEPAHDRYTVLDPNLGLQEMTGLPFWRPTDDDSLKFSGAIAVLA